MKNVIIFISVSIVMSMLSCQDTKYELQTTEDLAAYKKVGEQIPSETGLRWLDVYKQSNTSGRDPLNGYSITADQITSMLYSVDDPTGMAFHYGLDESGIKHIIAIPVDGSLSLWTAEPDRIFIDTNSGTELTLDQATAWTSAYQLMFPDKVWFHFFGEDIFNEMGSIPYFHKLDIRPATSDIDFSPQLLLIVWNEQLQIGGRADYENATFYDASNPCPPCSVHY